MEGKHPRSIIRCIRVERVVFGINSSPFLAQFVLQHHARKHQADHGRATETILKSTYMDDSMDSVQDEKQGIGLYRQLSCLFNKAGMHAHKLLSNSPTVLSEVQIQEVRSGSRLRSSAVHQNARCMVASQQRQIYV